MLNDPDLRNVDETTNGDCIAFELFDAGTWREFRISHTALDMLGAGKDLQPMESFGQNLSRIKGVAFNARKVGNRIIILSPESFE